MSVRTLYMPKSMCVHTTAQYTHQFCHCMTPIEHLHVKYVYMYMSLCVHTTDTRLQTSTGHSVCHCETPIKYLYVCIHIHVCVYNCTVHRYTDINLQGTNSEMHIEHLNVSYVHVHVYVHVYVHNCTVCAHVSIHVFTMYTTVQYVHTCKHRRVQGTNSATARDTSSTCM